MCALRRSPLDARHRELDATMTEFGGWEMPVDYGSVVAEHRAVRESCGLFDLSHLGAIGVTGESAEACVQQAFSNDASALVVGRAQYTLCLDEDGGIVDDLLVYRLPWGFFAVPNAANTAAVGAVLSTVAVALGDCQVADLGDDLACLAVQGPAAASVLTATGVDVTDLTYLDCRVWSQPASGTPTPAAGVLSRSGYTGERGYELFVPASEAVPLWDRIVEAGAMPVGLGARDTLRLEMGYPLHGQDISPATSPVEARSSWAVKPGTGFVGEEAYLRAKEAGPARRLWGLRTTGRGIPRAGCGVTLDGRPVGEVTSGTFSPTLRIGVALGYLDTSIDAGAHVDIDVRGKSVPAEVVRPPFVDASPKD